MPLPFLFPSLALSGPFGCRLASAPTTQFAPGVGFDSAKGVGGAGPSKKHRQDVSAGYTEFNSAAGQGGMKHAELGEALELRH